MSLRSSDLVAERDGVPELSRDRLVAFVANYKDAHHAYPDFVKHVLAYYKESNVKYITCPLVYTSLSVYPEVVEAFKFIKGYYNKGNSKTRKVRYGKVKVENDDNNIPDKERAELRKEGAELRTEEEAEITTEPEMRKENEMRNEIEVVKKDIEKREEAKREAEQREEANREAEKKDAERKEAERKEAKQRAEAKRYDDLDAEKKVKREANRFENEKMKQQIERENKSTAYDAFYNLEGGGNKKTKRYFQRLSQRKNITLANHKLS